MAYTGRAPSAAPLTSADINDGAVAPADLSTGAPSWDTSGNLTVGGGNVILGDNDKAIFGAGSDLQIYHDGSNSVIKDAGTGNLAITADNLLMESNNGDNYFYGSTDGAVYLYYDGAGKLTTTSTGIDVTGNIELGDSHLIGNDQYDNLGLYSSAGEGIALKTAAYVDFREGDSALGTNDGARRMLIDAGGDISFYEDSGTTAKFFWDASAEWLGIGTSSPSYVVDAQSASDAVVQARTTTNSSGNDAYFRASLAGASAGDAFIQFDIDSVGGYALGIDNSDSDKLKLNYGGPATPSSGTNLLSVTTSGNVGIGTSSPTEALHIQNGSLNLQHSSGTPTIRMNDEGIGSCYIKMPDGSNSLTVETGGTERMRIDSSGQVLIGTSSVLTGGIDGLHINTSLDTGITFGYGGASKGWLYYVVAPGNAMQLQTSTGTTIRMVSSTAGVSLSNGATSWSSLSDERRKDIIEPIENAAEKISTLRAVIGKFKEDEEGTRRAFLIAQDVQKVLPEAITEEKNGDLLLQYTETIPLLVAGIKEQQALIQALETRIAALESN